jgi:hypothetical protein
MHYYLELLTSWDYKLGADIDPRLDCLAPEHT